MTYLLIKWTFLLATAPIWVIPYAISQWQKHRRPRVKVVVKNYRR